MAENSGFKYWKPKGNEAMQAIRELVIAGHSSHEIMSRLQLPERTFHRYLRQIFAFDREVLATNNPREEVMNQIVILQDRFTQLYRQCQQLVVDKV